MKKLYAIGIDIGGTSLRAALLSDGDVNSWEILKGAGRYLGVGLSNILHLFGPETIILTGELTRARNIYNQEAIRESRKIFKRLFDAVKICSSSLVGTTGIAGSSCLVFTCQKI